MYRLTFFAMRSCRFANIVGKLHEIGIVEMGRPHPASGALAVLFSEYFGDPGHQVVRRVRIHALGFPVRPDAPQFTSVRFATLMRELCARNGGTFVGLNEPASYRR